MNNKPFHNLRVRNSHTAETEKNIKGNYREKQKKTKNKKQKTKKKERTHAHTHTHTSKTKQPTEQN